MKGATGKRNGHPLMLVQQRFERFRVLAPCVAVVLLLFIMFESKDLGVIFFASFLLVLIPHIQTLRENSRLVKRWKAALQKSEYMATHDWLTGLPNRRHFHEQLAKRLELGRQANGSFAVIVLDLDHFQLVNDTLGHRAGDRLLQAVAVRLGQYSHRAAWSISRLGGDEFALIAEGATRVEAEGIANRVLSIVSEPYFLAGRECYMSVSIGISLYPCDGEDPNTLLKHADTALYHAKEAGANTFRLYTPNMEAAMSNRIELEVQMRKALKNGEFLLHYQPQIDLKSGSILGVEALIRWNHPSMGIVPPNRFIPLAESNGLIVPISEWSLLTACAQLKAWDEAGLPLVRVSVNLSGRLFERPNLLEMIQKVLRQTKLDPSCLELEITESTLVRIADTAELLMKLNRLGVRISLDDFGMGFSSIHYLKGLPIHSLKIDRSFVKDITTQPKDWAVVKTIIDLAHHLDLRVVAEGVEQKEQLEMLKQHGCDAVQGFLTGRPASADEISRILEMSETISSNF